MNVGSVFTGIGGFDLGLERAGHRIVWQCESDPFCRRVLVRHWPDVPCYEDVCRLTGADVAPVDVLCGGFPCQDLSFAGLRAGIDGRRSGLWSEMVRLVRELRPRYVLVENVPGLLTAGLGRVLGDLAASGYDAEWDCIPAAAVGAPHRRDRVWIIAYPDSEGEHARAVDAKVAGAPQPVGHAEGNGRGPGRPRRPLTAGEGQRVTVRSLQDLADTNGPRRSDAEGGAGPAEPDGGPIAGAHDALGGTHEWAPEPGMDRVAHGIPDRMDRLRSLGNALVPQIAEWIGQRL